ncbi:hypothetical protein DV515_00001280 [Chloebia gouldiae]|uniref:Uncharacterized protein n=1 Tax=Chloebia gouldiae TaxID=44316 RepID=A0A3L8SYM4_CHLGU|nr:hypothetical protein DV515_00001280 [Chloebia gouldiae]
MAWAQCHSCLAAQLQRRPQMREKIQMRATQGHNVGREDQRTSRLLVFEILDRKTEDQKRESVARAWRGDGVGTNEGPSLMIPSSSWILMIHGSHTWERDKWWGCGEPFDGNWQWIGDKSSAQGRAVFLDEFHRNSIENKTGEEFL